MLPETHLAAPFAGPNFLVLPFLMGTGFINTSGIHEWVLGGILCREERLALRKGVKATLTPSWVFLSVAEIKGRWKKKTQRVSHQLPAAFDAKDKYSQDLCPPGIDRNHFQVNARIPLEGRLPCLAGFQWGISIQQSFHTGRGLFICIMKPLRVCKIPNHPPKIKSHTPQLQR